MHTDRTRILRHRCQKHYGEQLEQQCCLNNPYIKLEFHTANPDAIAQSRFRNSHDHPDIVQDTSMRGCCSISRSNGAAEHTCL